MIHWSLILLPVIAAFGNALYLTVAKFFFRTFGRLSSNEFNWVLFAWLIIVLLFIFPLLGAWPNWDQVRTVLWPLFGVVALATAYNVLFSWGMEHEHISEVQPFLLFNPLMTILVAGVFYADQRIWQIYIAAAVASLVLVWSHLRKSHFVWTKALAAISIFIVLNAFEVVLLRPLLEVFPPLGLYLIRCVLVLVGLSLITPPKLEKVKLHHLPYFFLMGSLAVLATWASYTSFKLVGISQTMFIFMLSPVLVYWLSAVFLKEKWRIRNIVASIIIIALVLWVSSFR